MCLLRLLSQDQIQTQAQGEGPQWEVPTVPRATRDGRVRAEEQRRVRTEPRARLRGQLLLEVPGRGRAAADPLEQRTGGNEAPKVAGGSVGTTSTNRV